MENINKTKQENINHVWERSWGNTSFTAKKIFGQRLLIEAYPVFKKHIPTDAKTLLEVGAGSGRYGLKFAQDFPNMVVTLTDILESSLGGMSLLKDEMGLSNVVIRREDALSLTFPANTFDVVFCDAVIQHLQEHEHAVAEMVRVLKPGGTLVLSSVNGWNFPHQLYKVGLKIRGKKYPYGYEKNFTWRELSRLCEDLGVHTITHDGFYFAYGVYRWKEHFQIFRRIGGALNRISRALDVLTGRWFSRTFGFEVFVVAQKPLK